MSFSRYGRLSTVATIKSFSVKSPWMNRPNCAGLNPPVPRDLETIVLKAMAKDPSSRYATAQDLAADLKRFLDDRPILARRPGPVERSFRWALRHRELVATTAAIFVVALIVSTAAIWAQARKTEIANNSLKDAIHKHNVLHHRDVAVA